MEAKAKIVEAIHEVAPDKAGAMVNHIFPRDQAPVLVDMFRAAATISGPVGNAYEILNSILKENKAPEKGEIAEVLEKALTQLHKQGEQAKTQSFGESAPKPQPQKFDFSEIKNAPQLLDFIQRDPLKDPVMQQVQDARKGVEAIADNENHKREIVAQQAETRANFNAFGVQLTGENLAAMPRVTVPQQIAMEPNEDVVAALKNSKIDEPENKIEAPLLARTAMLGMAAGAL